MSQNDQIHELLKQGPVTALDALQKCGSFRLAARVYELREQGVPIVTRYITRNQKTIAQYRLSTIEKAGTG